MFAVAKTRWWRKPKYIVTLAAAVLGAVATIVAAVIIVSLEKTDPPQRHDTLRPISLPPTTSITEIKQVCGRRPQIDNRGEPAHVTYHLTIQNTSQKTVSVSVARLNIARIGYQPDPYPPSNLHWHGCGDFNFNKASVCIPAGATEGQSIHFEVNLELPPRSTRDMYLFVCRHHPAGKLDECFLAQGAVTFYPKNGDEFTTGNLYFAGEPRIP